MMTALVRHASSALLLGLLALCGLRLAHAQLTIEIIGGGATQMPVAVVGFGNESTWPQGVTEVVAADLQRSGLFRLVEAAAVVPRPVDALDVRHADWRARGAEAVVVGSMTPQPGGQIAIRFFLVDVVRQVTLLGQTYTVPPGQLRAAAHRIADAIYEKLTGDPGVFSTKVAYVVKQGARFLLQVADADGFNPQTVVGSDEPIMSPVWSPEGRRLAYVSFEQKKPVVYVQDLGTGARRALANFRGSNSAPAWSPDGRQLAVALTRDSPLQQIYLINADGSGLTRFTRSGGIDTEPRFTPDGSAIVFVSDRGGGPQIYRQALSGGTVERVTFEGTYNVSPRPSPDGKSLAYVRRDGGRFVLVIQDLASRQTQVLTQGPNDESPSFAPNGRMLLYAAEQGGRGILAAVSSDGRVKQRLVSTAGDVREPAWGPLAR